MNNPLLTLPANPYEAPAAITLPKEVFEAAMADMWKRSFYTSPEIKSTVGPPQPGIPKVQEYAYTIVVEKATQVMHAYYPRGIGHESAVQAEWDTKDPNLQVVGVMHTHPFRDEAKVQSIDAIDAGRMLKFKGNFAMVLTGSGVTYLFLRTKATVQGDAEVVDAGWLNKNFDEAGKKMWVDHGAHMTEVAEEYAAETARHTHLAYYRGAALVLSRIWPKIGEKPPAPARHAGKPRSRW